MVSQVGESATGNSLVTSDPWFAQPTIQQLMQVLLALLPGEPFLIDLPQRPTYCGIQR